MQLVIGSIGGDYDAWIKEVLPSKHNLRVEMDITSLIIPFLIDGLAPGLILRSMVTKELANGSLVEIPLLGKSIPPCWRSYMIYASKKKDNPVIQDFLSLLG